MSRIVCSALLGMMLAGCVAGGRSEEVSRITDPQAVLGTTSQWVSTITPSDV